MTIFYKIVIDLIRDKCTETIRKSQEMDGSIMTQVGNGVANLLGFAPFRNTSLAGEKRGVLAELLERLEGIRPQENDEKTLNMLQGMITEYYNSEVALTRDKTRTGSDKPLAGTTEKMLNCLILALPAIRDQFANLRLIEQEYNEENPDSCVLYLLALYFSKRIMRREEAPEEVIPQFVTQQETLIIDAYNKYLAKIAKFEADESSNPSNELTARLFLSLKAHTAQDMLTEISEGSPIGFAPYTTMLKEPLDEIRPKLKRICNILDGVEGLEYEEAVTLNRPARGVVRAPAAAPKHALSKQPIKAPPATELQRTSVNAVNGDPAASQANMAPPRADSSSSAASLQLANSKQNLTNSQIMDVKAGLLNAPTETLGNQGTSFGLEQPDLEPDEPAPPARPATPEHKSQPETSADGRESPSRILGLLGGQDKLIAVAAAPAQKAVEVVAAAAASEPETPPSKLTRAQKREAAAQREREAAAQREGEAAAQQFKRL